MTFKFYPIVTAFFLAIAAPVDAVTLNPGGVVATSGTTFAADPDLGGTVINDNLIPFSIAPFNAFQTVGGNVQNRVVESDNLSTLIFAPRIRDTFNIATAAPWEWIGFQLDGYAGYAVDVDFRLDGLGDVGFTSVSRSVDGDLMTFRYDTPITVDGLAPGVQEESLFPSIKTDAVNYALTGSMTIFGQSTGDDDTLFSVTIDGLAAPVAPIPAPLPALLLLGGLSGFGVLRRRR